MTQITVLELVNILNTIDKPTFTYIVSETPVKMNKVKKNDGTKENNPYFDKVKKLRKGRFLIGSDYEKRVQGNDKKEGGEGTFESKESSVGTHISKCVLFNETYNRYYLSLERFPEVPPTNEYLFEGNPIENELFSSWIKETESYSNQPQEKKVEWTTLTLTNIKQISINKEQYEIVEG